MRFHESSEVFVRCFYDKACTTGDTNNPLQKCEDKYDGTLCASCDSSAWKPYGTYLCYSCGPEIVNTIGFALRPLLFIGLVILLTKQFLRKWNKKNQETAALVRILINMYQIMNIISLQPDDNLNKNPLLKLYLDYKITYLTPMNYLFDLNCMDHIFGTTDPESRYYLTLQVYAIIPIVL